MNPQHRLRLIHTAHNSAETYAHIVAGATHTALTTYRDGGDGWTALEALCHVRDFDAIFLARARLILAEDTPHLQPQDHDQLVIDGNYNAQDPAEAVAALRASRAAFITLFEGLTEAQWSRAGHHPEREAPFTLTDALVQVATHDITHLEQMTRTLSEQRT